MNPTDSIHRFEILNS